MKTLKDFDFHGKRALVRCDFNVPLDEKGNILDDFKIRQTLKTINYLLENGATVILMSHLGRPDGRIIENLKMTPVAERLSELLGRKINIGDGVASPGGVVLLENIKFNPGEKNNDPNFARKLASLGDVFVMEAFAQAHRNYASIAGIDNFLPSCAGFLFEREIHVLSDLLEKPKRPLTVIIGGAKVEQKSKLIEKFLSIADSVLVSGLIQKEINDKKMKFENQTRMISPVGDLGAKDVNQETVKMFTEKINDSKTVFWNGPVGKFEEEEFSKGTKAIAKAIIKSGAFSVVGGGETVEFIDRLGLRDKFSHVSTGGGAMMAFLSGEKLPGLIALG